MIGHEAVTEERENVQPHVAAEKVPLDGAFLIGSEQELTSVATLSEVVGDINDCNTNQAIFLDVCWCAYKHAPGAKKTKSKAPPSKTESGVPKIAPGLVSGVTRPSTVL